MVKTEILTSVFSTVRRATGIETFREESKRNPIGLSIESLVPALLYVMYPAILSDSEQEMGGVRSFRAGLVELASTAAIIGLALNGRYLEAVAFKLSYNLSIEVLPDALRSIRKNFL